MILTPQKPYHPTLRKMLTNWTTQYPYKKNQEALIMSEDYSSLKATKKRPP